MKFLPFAILFVFVVFGTNEEWVQNEDISFSIEGTENNPDSEDGSQSTQFNAIKIQKVHSMDFDEVFVNRFGIITYNLKNSIGIQLHKKIPEGSQILKIEGKQFSMLLMGEQIDQNDYFEIEIFIPKQREDEFTDNILNAGNFDNNMEEILNVENFNNNMEQANVEETQSQAENLMYTEHFPSLSIDTTQDLEEGLLEQIIVQPVQPVQPIYMPELKELIGKWLKKVLQHQQQVRIEAKNRLRRIAEDEKMKEIIRDLQCRYNTVHNTICDQIEEIKPKVEDFIENQKSKAKRRNDTIHEKTQETLSHINREVPRLYNEARTNVEKFVKDKKAHEKVKNFCRGDNCKNQ